MGTSCSLILPEPGLYLGGIGVFPMLKAYGIQASLSVCQNRPSERSGVDVLQFHIRDSPDQELSDILAEAIEFILANRLDGKVVLVHCRAGVSRSATFLTAYFMTVFGWSRDEALKYIVRCRSVVGPNSGFMKTLYDFELDCRDELRHNLQEKYGEAFKNLVSKDLLLVSKMQTGCEYNCEVHYTSMFTNIGVHSSMEVGFLLRAAKEYFVHDCRNISAEDLQDSSIWHGEHLDPELRFEDVKIIKDAPFALIHKSRDPLVDDERFKKNHGHRFQHQNLEGGEEEVGSAVA